MGTTQDQRLGALLARAIDIMNPDGSVTGVDRTSDLETVVFLLANSKAIHLGQRLSAEEREHIVGAALRRLAGVSQVQLDQLQQAIEAEVSALNRAPRKQFEVLLAMNVDGTPSAIEDLLMSAFRVANSSVAWRILRPVEAFSRYRLDANPLAWAGVAAEYQRECRKYTYCCASVRSRDPREAITVAYSAYETARAWLNLTFSFRRRTIICGPRRQLSRISPCQVSFCFDANGDYVESGYTSSTYNTTVTRLTDAEIAQSSALLADAARSSQGGAGRRVQTAVLLYGEALDQHSEAYRFLNLWQVLEVLLGTSAEHDIQKLAGSVCASDELTANAIGPLCHKRNKLVHQGQISDFTLRDVNVLREVVDAVLWVALCMAEKLTNAAEMDDFWRFWALDKTSLRRASKVIRAVSRLRKKKLQAADSPETQT